MQRRERIMTGQIVEAFRKIHPRIRARFPQIDKDIEGNRRVYLNNGGGTLMVDAAVEAMAQAAREACPQPGVTTPGEVATARLHRETRSIIADFLNAPDPNEISFHVSTTHALFTLAFAMRSILTGKNNVIVTDIDHMANVSVWEDLWGGERRCEIRRARVTEGGLLDEEHLLSLVDGDTGLVAVTLASNGFGTLVPVGKIVPRIRERSPGCLVCVDAVHHALHGPIDVQAMGCDFLAFSGYKVFGPMLGVLWGRMALLERLKPYRVETNKDEPPYKFEMGTLNNAVLASMKAALEYLLWIAEEMAPGLGRKFKSRREKFTFAMEAVQAYDSELTRTVLEGFEAFDAGKFKCYGVTDPDSATRRDPTFAFEIRGRSSEEIKRYLWEKQGFEIATGHLYAGAIYRHLKNASLCRASFAHYDTLDSAREFVNALKQLME
jgi:selenocysteine lyase/cysteine desulfurase